MVNSVCRTITSSVPCSRSSFDSANPLLLCRCHISISYFLWPCHRESSGSPCSPRELQSENNQGSTDEETFAEDRMFPGGALRPHDRRANRLDRAARTGTFSSHHVDL